MKNSKHTSNPPPSPDQWLCDACIAGIVRRGGRPLFQIYGPGEAPFRSGLCENCGKEENISKYPRGEGTPPPIETEVVAGDAMGLECDGYIPEVWGSAKMQSTPPSPQWNLVWNTPENA